MTPDGKKGFASAMHHLVTVSLASGGINHLFDGTGGTAAHGGAMVAKSAD